MAGNRHDYGEVGKRLLVSIRVLIRTDASQSRVPKLQVCQQRSKGANKRMGVALNVTLGFMCST